MIRIGVTALGLSLPISILSVKISGSGKLTLLVFISGDELKARLHRRFLSRQLDAIFVAAKLHQVSNMFETPAISRRQITMKIAPGLHMQF